MVQSFMRAVSIAFDASTGLLLGIARRSSDVGMLEVPAQNVRKNGGPRRKESARIDCRVTDLSQTTRLENFRLARLSTGVGGRTGRFRDPPIVTILHEVRAARLDADRFARHDFR